MRKNMAKRSLPTKDTNPMSAAAAGRGDRRDVVGRWGAALLPWELSESVMETARVGAPLRTYNAPPFRFSRDLP
jgi:hypothetical protein